MQFVDQMEFRAAAEPIPIYRHVGTDGTLPDHLEMPFSDERALELYKYMLRVAVCDQVLYDVQRQGRISFYMTSTGEEATTVGTAAALEPEDVCWPQYRELGLFIYRGFTIQEVVDQCASVADEEGKGRQMPIHYCSASRNIHAVTSPLATGIPHAAGAGYAFKIEGQNRVAVAYFGDGAASEGDFAVALNFAATLGSQTIFVCRNNGYAISTPVSEQYAGDGIAVRGLAYGLPTLRVDGNDLISVYNATKAARELCVREQRPVLMELMTYRVGHHSTSDDASRYRSVDEVSTWTEDGVSPLGRMFRMLRAKGLWDEGVEKQFRAAVRAEVINALKAAEKKQKGPLRDIFTDVYDELNWAQQEQYQELLEHVKRHPKAYDLSKYRPS